MNRYLPLSLFFLTLASCAWAQDDLSKLLDQEAPKTKNYAAATFKGTRIINSHSVETVKAKHMDFLIQHRFGPLNDMDNFFGLDIATLRLGFEFGITDRLMLGIGRTNVQKAVDIFGKYRLLRQAADGSPVSVTVFGSAVNKTIDEGVSVSFQNRLTYCSQLLIARKFSDDFSLQISPTFLYRNRPEAVGDTRALFAVGVGGRYKLSKRISINADYYWTARDGNAFKDRFGSAVTYHNALALGVDIETGGHVFQMHFTNAMGMNEKQFIGETTSSWGDGAVRYGFNISRTFSFDRRARSMDKPN
ncbi:MAG: DUF5777 family beta-barrel protein [Spirosomaceae bacterium]|jgi:hypothetical protein|nr:DUF5777 family beta-barrel protein [Spirosomataceae bacterium]